MTEFEPTLNDEVMSENMTLTTNDNVMAELATANEPKAKAAGTRRSSRIRSAPKSYEPSMKGKSYGYTATQINADTINPKVIGIVMIQLTL